MTAAMLAKVHEEPITLANFAQVRCQPESSHVSDRLLSLDESVQELADLVYIGGAKGLVLDCTSVQQGRSAAGLVEVGRRSGLHVVMAASWVSTVIPGGIAPRWVSHPGGYLTPCGYRTSDRYHPPMGITPCDLSRAC